MSVEQEIESLGLCFGYPAQETFPILKPCHLLKDSGEDFW